MALIHATTPERAVWNGASCVFRLGWCVGGVPMVQLLQPVVAAGKLGVVGAVCVSVESMGQTVVGAYPLCEYRDRDQQDWDLTEDPGESTADGLVGGWVFANCSGACGEYGADRSTGQWCWPGGWIAACSRTMPTLGSVSRMARSARCSS